MATETALKYQIVIGLEVHAQLRTESKLFCSCSTKFGAEPNANTCPVCMGYPGVLPVLNERAVEYAIKAGLALGCQIDLNSKFDRKQYFYPDLPKGYQISQYDKPICNHGKLNIGSKDVRILRIHMEEDAGKLVHSGAERLHGSDYSLVDLNRASTPLIEIVSEPDIRSADEAVAYVKELRKILLYIGVCDGNMQEGSLRCDINISLNKPGAEKFGTRAEIKNVNSFRSISRAIEYEYKRQSEILDQAGTVVQETRLFDENTGKTHSMRSKEDAHDYRYFPEPDLLPLTLNQKQIDTAKTSLPELPQQKRSRYIAEFNINEDTATTLTDEVDTAIYFEEVIKSLSEKLPDARLASSEDTELTETSMSSPRNERNAADGTLRIGSNAVKAANWLVGPVAAYLNESKLSIRETKLTATLLAEMIKLIDQGIISDNIAKNDIINELLVNGGSVQKLIDDKGLAQITDTGALETVIKEVISANPKQVEQYKSGNAKIQGFFVGQVMKLTQGKASPAMVNEILAKLL